MVSERGSSQFFTSLRSSFLLFLKSSEKRSRTRVEVVLGSVNAMLTSALMRRLRASRLAEPRQVQSSTTMALTCENLG